MCIAMYVCLSKSLTELSSPVPMACNIIDRIAVTLTVGDYQCGQGIFSDIKLLK